MTTLETPPRAVGTGPREWDVRVCDDIVQVVIHDASAGDSHNLYPEDPRTRTAISLCAEHARELALELQDAARHVEEDVLSEWGVD